MDDASVTRCPHPGHRRRWSLPKGEGTNKPLPLSREEMIARGWDAVDVVFVTGDAYVDHPSFAMALLGRLLEAEGYRVGILSQPDWRSCEPWRTFGKPRLCFAVSAGNMDSMLNHYTANCKVRNDDAYSPDGEIGRRPDRATLAYCQRAREAYPGMAVVAGGVEASLRRLAHYDYWSDRVRRADHPQRQGRPDRLRHGRAALAGDCRPAGGGRADSRDSRRSRHGLSPRRRGGGRGNRRISLSRWRGKFCPPAELRRGLRRQAGVCRHDPLDPSRDQPRQRPAAGAIP